VARPYASRDPLLNFPPWSFELRPGRCELREGGDGRAIRGGEHGGRRV